MRLAVPGPCAMTSSQIFSRRGPFNSLMSAFTFLKLAMQFSMGGRVAKERCYTCNILRKLCNLKGLRCTEKKLSVLCNSKTHALYHPRSMACTLQLYHPGSGSH